MFSLFICVTQDGWMGIFNDFREKSKQDDFLFVVGCIYFFICILIGAFVFANLVVAVMVTNLDKAMKEVQAEKKKNEDTLATKPSGDESEGAHDTDVPIISVNEVIKSVDLSSQNPLHNGDFKHLTHEKLESLLLVMTALEDNIGRYKNLREELDEIFNTVWDLNLKAFEDSFDEDEWLDSPPSSSTGTRHRPSTNMGYIGKRGDILSNLLALERDTGFTSKTASKIGDVIQQSARLIDQSMYGPMPERKSSFIGRAKLAKNAARKTQKTSEASSAPTRSPPPSSD
ncbi:cation channel sperm-associated protein 4-like [Ptychodera flava]|uniref:cation channel sperm-associated protein 4-like n=1 Tax=Ptychodera flava TaxID=63121 RepID=UPI003969FC9D